MTITDIVVVPTRDVELGTGVDESSNQQDTEAEVEAEKSFFESYADWFVGLVYGDSIDNGGDEAAAVAEAETVQYQNEYLNDNEDEEVIPPREVSSSSSPSRVRVSSTPPRPQLQSPPWQEEWSFGCIDMHRCPMILQPFACLIQLIILLTVSAVSTVYFFAVTVVLIFFGGERIMYNATYDAKESNMLMEKYKKEGVNVDGNVERIWSDWEYNRSGGSDGPSHVLVERALIRYEYGDDQYRMGIMPLRKHVKNSIGPHDTIPIVLLTRDPDSGIPEVCVEDFSRGPVFRILVFTFGLAISTLWTILPVVYYCFLLADENEDKPDNVWKNPYFNDSTTSSQSQNASPDWRILVAIVFLVGILPNALFFIWKGFRDRILSFNIAKTKSHKDLILDDIQVWSV